MKFDRFKIVFPPGMSKKQIAVLLSLSCLSLVMIIHGFYRNFIKPGASANSSVTPPENTVQTSATAVRLPVHQESGSAMPVKNKSGQVPKEKTTSQKTAEFALIDPFIEISTLPKIGMGSLSPISAPGSIPRPSVGNIPVPPVPSVPGGNGTKNSDPVLGTQSGVQGILINPNGDNMAIMGDGTVVTEGQTFKDNRISYIGDDGVTFADGTFMEYKTSGFNNK